MVQGSKSKRKSKKFRFFEKKIKNKKKMMESFLESHKTGIRPENLTNRDRDSLNLCSRKAYEERSEKEKMRKARRESNNKVSNVPIRSNLQERYLNYIRSRDTSTYSSPYKDEEEIIPIAEEKTISEENKCEIEVWRRIRKRTEEKGNNLKKVARGLLDCESARESLKTIGGTLAKRKKHRKGSVFDDSMLFHITKSVFKN